MKISIHGNKVFSAGFVINSKDIANIYINTVERWQELPRRIPMRVLRGVSSGVMYVFEDSEEFGPSTYENRVEFIPETSDEKDILERLSFSTVEKDQQTILLVSSSVLEQEEYIKWQVNT